MSDWEHFKTGATVFAVYILAIGALGLVVIGLLALAKAVL
jgi:preprotein translocase subunit Sss1